MKNLGLKDNSAIKILLSAAENSKDDSSLVNGKISTLHGVFEFHTRFECSFTSSPLVSSVVLHLLHSFRV